MHAFIHSFTSPVSDKEWFKVLLASGHYASEVCFNWRTLSSWSRLYVKKTKQKTNNYSMPVLLIAVQSNRSLRCFFGIRDSVGWWLHAYSIATLDYTIYELLVYIWDFNFIIPEDGSIPFTICKLSVINSGHILTQCKKKDFQMPRYTQE